MFFHVPLTHEVILHPQHFGRNMREQIKEKLYNDVEGQINGLHGYIIAVVSIDEIGDANIVPGRGHVIITVKYKAIVYMPFPGEVVDGVVKVVSKIGLYIQVGPMNVFLHSIWLPGYSYDGSSNPPCFRNDEGEQIRVDDAMRIQIMRVLCEVNRITVLGTLSGDYLGQLEV